MQYMIEFNPSLGISFVAEVSSYVFGVLSYKHTKRGFFQIHISLICKIQWKMTILMKAFSLIYRRLF